MMVAGPPQGLTDLANHSGGAFIRKVKVLSDQRKGE